MLKLAYLLAVLLVINGAAKAHSWYPRDCCHDADCRPVPCAELVATRNGLMWRGAVIFNDQQIKASQDESCHVCAKAQQNAIVPYLPFCLRAKGDQLISARTARRRRDHYKHPCALGRGR
jgi:hypothetical protein